MAAPARHAVHTPAPPGAAHDSSGVMLHDVSCFVQRKFCFFLRQSITEHRGKTVMPC